MSLLLCFILFVSLNCLPLVASLGNDTICGLLTPSVLETPCVYLNNSDPCPAGLICSTVNATGYAGPESLRCSCIDPCPSLGSAVASDIVCNYNNITEAECPAGYVLDNAKSGVFDDIGGGGCQCKCPDLKTNFGVYCAAGDVGLRPCIEGFYCPDPSKQIICPQGYYCRFGTKEPKPCPLFSYCPAGTERAVLNAAGITFNLIILVILYLFHFISKKKKKKKLLDQKLGKSTLNFEFSNSSFIAGGLNLIKSTANTLFDIGDIPQLVQPIKGFPALEFRMDLRVHNLHFELSSGATVLDDVTAEFPSGTLTAILGPSGAGKTSCMSAIIGSARAIGKVTGDILVNNLPQEDGLARFKNLIGYVPQDDVLHNSLTVRENIWYSILLRQSFKPKEDQLELLESILKILELTRVADTQVGTPEKRGISGGERRRVSIGVALAATPALLFGDELTSGLDATTARSLLLILHRLALNGVNIILTLHQPRYEIFTLLDNLLLLGAGGTTVYSGPCDRSLGYFLGLGYKIEPHVNPADFILDCVSGYYTPRLNLPSMWIQRHGDYLVTNTGLIQTIRRQVQKHKGTRKGKLERQDTGVILRSETETTVAKLSFDDNRESSGSPYATEDVTVSSLDPTDDEAHPPEIETPTQIANSAPDLFRRSSSSSSALSFDGGRPSTSSITGLEARPSTSSLGGDSFLETDIRTVTRRRFSSLHLDYGDERYNDPPGLFALNEKLSKFPNFIHDYYLLRFYQDFYRNRRGFWFQLWTFYKRAMIQQWRNRNGIVTDLLLVFFAGAVIGLFYSYVFLPDYLSASFAVTMTIGLTGVLPATRTFTVNRVVFWREASNGINRPAYYLAELAAQMVPPMVLSPLIFLTSFYSMYQPRTSLVNIYLACLFCQWCVFGIGYFISLLTKPQQSILGAATIILISIMISGNSPSLSDIEKLGPIAVFLSNLSYARWMNELLTLLELSAYITQTGQSFNPPPEDVARILESRSYEFGNETTCYLWLFFLGFLLRFFGFLALRLNHRKRQA